MYLYDKLLENPNSVEQSRTFIFGAKAASGYRRAKLIIKLINTLAERINNDRRVRGRLRVVFVENYRVSLAEKIFPASDVSEQISTAGKEASGTGNMKFMLNGALTIGTMDGANIEIVEEAGKENAFIFGLTTDQITDLEVKHSYNPKTYIQNDLRLGKILNQLVDGTFAPDTEVFRELHNSLVYGVEGQRPDIYYVLADFASYVKAQEAVAKTYGDKKLWAQKALINIANSGKFSSDRTIEDYVRDIWHLEKLC
jgi:starch phosphorylase